MRAEKVHNEETRLAALRRYRILDTPRELAFDELAQHIAHVCQTPIALITFVDEHRQWFKAEVGLNGTRETSLDDSVCAHNIVHPGLLIVPDLTADERFAGNELVRDMQLRFYAGYSLDTPDGHTLGTCCVLDHRPRELSEEQTFALRTIARQVMIQLELRRVAGEHKRLLESYDAANRLQEERDFLAAILECASDAIVACDKDGVLRLFNQATRELHGLPEQPIPAEEWADYYSLYFPDGRTPMKKENVPLYRALHEGMVQDVEMVVAPKGRPPRWLLASGRAVWGPDGQKAGAIVVMHDITVRKQAEEQRLRFVEARAAREAAEESQRRVTQVLESITDAFFLLDREWRFTYANKQAEVLLRRSRDELMGRVVWEAFPEAVGSQFEREYRRAVDERSTARFEAFFQPLQSWFNVTAYPSPEGLSVYFTDVTERKCAEHALLEKERRFRAVFNQQFQFMALLSPEGLVLEINDLPLQVTGFAREAVVDRPIWETPFWKDLPDDRQQWAQQVAAAARGSVRVTTELRFQSADGTVRVADTAITPVNDENGRLVFLIAEGKDITEREEAERQLRESEQRFRMLVHQVKDYAIFMTDPEGFPNSWNEGVERILRYGEHEFIDLDPHALYTPEDNTAKVPEKELAEAAATGTASDDRWLVRNGGERFWASGMTTAVRDKTGRLVGFAKVFRDLTEKKRIEDQLREAQEQLQRHADDLEHRVNDRTAKLQESVSELEAFSYSVSHDLRAPLRAMQGYSQFLLEDYGHVLDTTGREYIARIRNAASRLDQLIQDILTYSRVARTQLELKPIDLERLIQDVLQAYPTLQPPKARIHVRRPLLKVMAHEASIMQCISNLLGNAVKFVPPERQPEVTVWTERRDENVRVWIQDNGIGISPEARQRIFRMFETAHQSDYEGTGIGLAIVRKAVERMGGSVGVESEPGQGSRFWLELKEGK